MNYLFYLYFQLLVAYGYSSRASGPLMIILATNLGSLICLSLRILIMTGLIALSDSFILISILVYGLSLFLSLIVVFVLLEVNEKKVYQEVALYKNESNSNRKINSKKIVLHVFLSILLAMIPFIIKLATRFDAI
jgi:hypothetical protein